MTVIEREDTVLVDAFTLNPSLIVASGDVFAGEELLAAAACFISIADGFVYMSGSDSGSVPTIHGYVARETDVGQPVTLFKRVRARYAAGSTPLVIGSPVYLGPPGVYDTAAVLELPEAVGFAVSVRDIYLHLDEINDQTTVSLFGNLIDDVSNDLVDELGNVLTVI